MGRPLTTVRFRGIDHFVDRNGHHRYYFRPRSGMKRIPLPGKPGDTEFLVAYLAAADGNPIPQQQKRRQGAAPAPLPVMGAPAERATRPENRTFSALVEHYYRSTTYLRLEKTTRVAYRRVIDRFVVANGHRRVDQMQRHHVSTIMGDMADRPGAANDLLKKLRVLMRVALDLGWRTDDPTFKIKKYAKGEYHTWTEEQIAQYEAHWPLGSAERTCLAVQLYTGQRRSDTVTLRWPVNGWITVRQQKTGAELVIPVHPGLQGALDVWERRDGPEILLTTFGTAFTAASYGNFMRKAIQAAGLPTECSTHGLRKAQSRRLAEVGCSEKEIASITGHESLAEVARYTKAARQRMLAMAAVGRQVNAVPETEISNPTEGWKRSAEIEKAKSNT